MSSQKLVYHHKDNSDLAVLLVIAYNIKSSEGWITVSSRINGPSARFTLV